LAINRFGVVKTDIGRLNDPGIAHAGTANSTGHQTLQK